MKDYTPYILLCILPEKIPIYKIILFEYLDYFLIIQKQYYILKTIKHILAVNSAKSFLDRPIVLSSHLRTTKNNCNTYHLILFEESSLYLLGNLKSYMYFTAAH